jgi:hypothetical protein
MLQVVQTEMGRGEDGTPRCGSAVSVLIRFCFASATHPPLVASRPSNLPTLLPPSLRAAGAVPAADRGCRPVQTGMEGGCMACRALSSAGRVWGVVLPLVELRVPVGAAHVVHWRLTGAGWTHTHSGAAEQEQRGRRADRIVSASYSAPGRPRRVAAVRPPGNAAQCCYSCSQCYRVPGSASKPAGSRFRPRLNLVPVVPRFQVPPQQFE